MYRCLAGPAFRLKLIVPFCVILATLAFAAEKDTKGNAAKRRKEAKLSEVEEDFVRAINTARKKADLKPLKVNAALVAACREYAGEMAKREKVADAFDGKEPRDRITNAGVTPKNWGITNGKGKPRTVVNGWATDPIAKANILEPNVNEIGIGVATDAAGENYIAAVYVEVTK